MDFLKARSERRNLNELKVTDMV